MVTYCGKRLKLAYKRPRMGRLSIVGLPVSIFFQIAGIIRSYAFITSGLSGGEEHCESKINIEWNNTACVPWVAFNQLNQGFRSVI